jgi:hypothetical protein
MEIPELKDHERAPLVPDCDREGRDVVRSLVQSGGLVMKRLPIVTLVGMGLLALATDTASAGPIGYTQTNLVSDLPGSPRSRTLS